MAPSKPELIRSLLTPDGRTGFHFDLHPGQQRAMNSNKRFVLILAGTRGGKTSTGPPWLWREMRRRGPGDYLVAAPTYRILDKAAVPELEHVFGRLLGLGKLNHNPFEFRISPEGEFKLWGRNPKRPSRIVFGHADDPDSLEAMTAKAAWLDEPGQKGFKLGSWEAIQRRLSTDEGRVLLTTTPYLMGWLQQRLYQPWIDAKRNHPTIDVIQFDSTLNPAFPRAEWERAKAELPGWRFRMFFQGQFERPSGLIYDAFDTVHHTCPRFTVPLHWSRFLGLDFGGVHTAGVFFAEDPGNGRLYAYREYGPCGGRTAAQHVVALLKDEPGIPICAGGSKSEQQWRDEFAAGGMPVYAPDVADVEVGINRVWGAFNLSRVRVFADLVGLLDELASYARVVDDQGNATQEIESKSDCHLADCCRYIIPSLVREQDTTDADTPTLVRVRG